MFKRLVVLCLALILSVAVIACTKKIDTEVSSGKDGSVIYVGKSRSLRDRVSSYFQGAHDTKTTRMLYFGV